MSDDPPSAREWRWDPSLYVGSARHYAVGRVGYPRELAERLADALDLDGSGLVLDIGCGPGSLTLLLAPYFAEAVGVDADGDMLAEAERIAGEAGVRNVTWRQLRAEDLPSGLGRVRVAAFAQSFHWMDRAAVAATVRSMLTADGAVVHVHATTHQGIETDAELPHPRPPRAAIDELVVRYLGPRPRAGQGLRSDRVAGDEEAIYRGAGFSGPQRLEFPERDVSRSADEVVASVYSLSSAAAPVRRAVGGIRRRTPSARVRRGERRSVQ